MMLLEQKMLNQSLKPLQKTLMSVKYITTIKLPLLSIKKKYHFLITLYSFIVIVHKVKFK